MSTFGHLRKCSDFQVTVTGWSLSVLENQDTLLTVHQYGFRNLFLCMSACKSSCNPYFGVLSQSQRWSSFLTVVCPHMRLFRWRWKELRHFTWKFSSSVLSLYQDACHPISFEVYHQVASVQEHIRQQSRWAHCWFRPTPPQLLCKKVGSRYRCFLPSLWLSSSRCRGTELST